MSHRSRTETLCDHKGQELRKSKAICGKIWQGIWKAAKQASTAAKKDNMDPCCLACFLNEKDMEKAGDLHLGLRCKDHVSSNARSWRSQPAKMTARPLSEKPLENFCNKGWFLRTRNQVSFLPLRRARESEWPLNASWENTVQLKY